MPRTLIIISFHFVFPLLREVTVDHECEIGRGVHIMGGVSIAGIVKIEDYVTIGANATIFPDIKISEGAFIGAGAVVTKNVGKNEAFLQNNMNLMLALGFSHRAN